MGLLVNSLPILIFFVLGMEMLKTQEEDQVDRALRSSRKTRIKRSVAGTVLDKTDMTTLTFGSITGCTGNSTTENVSLEPEADWVTLQNDNITTGDGNIKRDIKPAVASIGGLPDFVNEGTVSKVTFEEIFRTVNISKQIVHVLAIVFCSFSVVVYSRRKMRSPTSTYLVALNVTELLYVISSIVISTTGDIYGETADTSLVYLSVMLYIGTYISVAIRRSTFCLTCLVSAEKFIAVAFPMKSMHFQLIRRPVLFIMSTVVMTFLFHAFNVIRYRVVSFQLPITNETLWKFELTEIGPQLDIWVICNQILFVYLQLVGCMVLNVAIIVALRYHRKQQKQLSINVDPANESRDRKMTITILVSSFIFVLLSLPTATNLVIRSLVDDYGSHKKEHYLFFCVVHIGVIFELLSNCTNFVVYMVLSSQFRSTFIGMFRCVRSGIGVQSSKQQYMRSLSSLFTSATPNSNVEP